MSAAVPRSSSALARRAVHMAVFFRSQIKVAAPFDRMSQPVEHLSIAYESGSMPTSSQHRSNSRSSILFPRYCNTLNRALCRSSRVRADHHQAFPLGPLRLRGAERRLAQRRARMRRSAVKARPFAMGARNCPRRPLICLPRATARSFVQAALNYPQEGRCVGGEYCLVFQ